MGRYYWNKKDEADDCKKIEIWTLKKWGYLDTSFRSGTITWTHGYSGNKSSVGIQSVMWKDEGQYIRIHYTQTDWRTEEKTDFDYQIPLTTTECHFGGIRYWFRCPWYKNGVYCGRRVGVIYKNGDYFACRHCYELSYASRNENRKHALSGLGRMLDLERKIEKLQEEITTPFYNGRPTRKYRRLIELKRQYYGFDAEKVLRDMDRMLGS
ncbi:hypothetical protein H6758_02535 [Candidatus Nomurabacteria bacterium]|nr:hypothetical protein [Candidatus Nomurabacteria bacterium]